MSDTKFRSYMYSFKRLTPTPAPEPIKQEEPKIIKRVQKPERTPYRKPPGRNLMEDSNKPAPAFINYSNLTGF